MSVEDVVIVTDAAHVNGGSGKVALSSARALAESGKNITVFTATGPVDTTLLTHERIEIICLDLHDILADPKRLRAATSGIWNMQTYHALKAVLRRKDARKTVVHFHGWTKALSASVISAARDAGFPIIVTLHEYFSACPIGSFYNHPEEKICTLTAMSAACIRTNCDSRSYAQKLWRVGRQVVQQRFARMPAGLRHFISVSQFSERILQPYLAEKSSVVHRIDNPIEVPEAQPADPALSRDFVFVGRLSKEKGAELFAQAAAVAGVSASVVGGGECSDAVATLNPALKNHGWQTARNTLRYLGSARAVVFPSVWYETVGMVPQEAAALGVPTVVSDACAAKESIIDNVTGLHFRSGDVNDLAEKLRVLQDDRVVRRLGLAAHERYWQSPSTMDRHVAGLYRAYEAVAADG